MEQMELGHNREKEIRSFETVLLRLSGMRYTAEYEILFRDGSAEISQYAIRFSKEGDQRVPEKRAVCSEKEILQLLNSCKLLAWDGFSGAHPKGVRDGIMFRLEAVVNGNHRIYATGSENFPQHFRDFTDGLNRFLSRDREGCV
ncbi:MAG: hypothetical protein II828_01365 [Clostridia bacterium]|nr:hypothetical protein [Clostridia bacterium]